MKSSIWKKFTSLLLVTALLFSLTSIPVLATEESADSETAISTGGETGEPSGETGEPGDETGEPGDETGEPGDETGEPGDETGEPGGETGEQPGDETGEQPGDETGEQPGDETGEPGDETGEQPGDETGEPGGETETGEQPQPQTAPSAVENSKRQTLSKTLGDGTTITLMGMPHGGDFDAVPVQVEIDGQLVLAAYDITIYDADGQVWQPDESDNVVVTFDTPELADVDEVTVYHLEDLDANPEYVDTVSVPGTEVQFTAESFSVYAITVTNNGYAPNETTYTTAINQPVTVTYSTRTFLWEARPTAPALPADTEFLKFSDLTEAGDENGLIFKYYKWTFTVTLTEQVVANRSYTFKMGGTNYTIKANKTNWTLEHFKSQAASHIDIRKTNATVDITTIVKDGSQEVGRSIVASVPAHVTGVNSITINGYTGTPNLGTDREDEFRYTFEGRIAIFRDNNPRVITVNINLETEDGRTISNIPVTFTPDDLFAAILNCDSFDSFWGIASGMDFYIRNAKAEIIEQVTSGTGTGTITITGNKTWHHGTNPENARPKNKDLKLTLHKWVSGNWEEMSATPIWNGDTYTFTVPYESHATVYTVAEAAVPGYTTTTASAAAVGYHTNVGTPTDVPNKNSLVYNLPNANFIIAKLTENNKFMIWTARQVAENEKAELLRIAKGIYNQVTDSNTSFIHGNGAVYNNPSKGTATLNYNEPSTDITFTNKSVWAQFAHGSMKTTYTPENADFTNTYTPGAEVQHPAKLNIQKTDDNKNPLKDVEFSLIKKDAPSGTVPKKATTNENGIATFTLGSGDEGAYGLYETKGLFGYDWTQEKLADITVTLEDGKPSLKLNGTVWDKIYNWLVGNGETTAAELTIPVVNAKIPTSDLTIKKEVTGLGASQTRIFNFKIEFGTMNGDEFVKSSEQTFSLKHDGTTTFNNLLAGTAYFITEIDVPTGYTQSIKDGVATGTIPADGGLVEVTFLNAYSSENNQPDRGFFDVKKVDADDNTKTLAGAIFKLVKNDGERTFVAEKQTNGSGIATFDNLEDGEYILTEEYAPANYEKDGNEWTVTVEQGIVTITDKEGSEPLLVKNTKKPAHLTVTKNVIGNQATLGQKFDFTVTLENLQSDAVRAYQLDGDESATDPLPKPADGTWSTNKGKNGTWSFEEGYTAVISVLLVDGETLTVNGLTPEMSYSVKETLLSGYTTSTTLNGQPVALINGEMPQGKIGDAQTESIQNPVVIFTNDAGNRTPRNPRPDRDDPISIPDPAVPLSPDPDVEIPEIDVPLGEAPEEDATVPMDAKPEEEVEISELSIPLGDMNTPQTGDNSNTALFALMAALSAIGLGALVFGKRNRNKG